jgi:hypothetical protein
MTRELKAWERDPYLWIDHYEGIGFRGYFVAGISLPIIAVTPVVGLPILLTSAALFFYALGMINRFPEERRERL